MLRSKPWNIFLCCATLFMMPLVARAAPLLIGVNVVGVPSDAAKQGALISQLKAAGVTCVRTGIRDLTGPDADARFGWVESLSAAGIKVELTVKPQFAPTAQARAVVPGFTADYGGYPLSAADPQLSADYFKKMFQMLDAKNVVLAGIELGNEYNAAAFNPEFPIPGHGQIYGLKDLTGGDAEARQIATGFVQYIKILAVLKDARDQSKLNQATPIISFGLASTGPAGIVHGGHTDAVTGNATIQFLRQNGMDKYVDAYGVHFYGIHPKKPSDLVPGLSLAVSQCGTGGGKPCWITEWGMPLSATACPIDDTQRVALFQTTMDRYRAYAAKGRLQAALFFDWGSVTDSKGVEKWGAYNCGALTQAGKVALTP